METKIQQNSEEIHQTVTSVTPEPADVVVEQPNKESNVLEKIQNCIPIVLVLTKKLAEHQPNSLTLLEINAMNEIQLEARLKKLQGFKENVTSTLKDIFESAAIEKIAKFKLAFVENREAVVGQLSEFGTELKKFMDLEAIHSLEMFLEWFSKIEEKSASKNTKSCHHSLKSKSKKKVSTINQYEDLPKLVNEDGTPSSNVDEDSDEEAESTEGSSVEESSTSWQTISSDEDSTSDNADSNEDSKEDQNEGVPLLMTDEDDTEESEDESSEDEENKEKLGPFEQLVDDACYLSVFTLILIKQLQQTKDEEIEVLKLLLNKSRAEIERMRSIEKKE